MGRRMEMGSLTGRYRLYSEGMHNANSLSPYYDSSKRRNSSNWTGLTRRNTPITLTIDLCHVGYLIKAQRIKDTIHL